MSRPEEEWIVAEHPGYLGSRRTRRMHEWTERYGEGNWRLDHWETADGKRLGYDEVFQIYVEGYEKYFREHPGEAQHLITNFSSGYDQDPITREQAFDPYALYNQPGVANQFHHVAFNRALVTVTGRVFQGTVPIQVREGKPGTPEEQQPLGWRWSPGRIPCATPEIIPQVPLEGKPWWQPGTIEDFYQRAKVLEVKKAKLV